MQVVFDDGKSASEHYVMRLNGEEAVSYLHPSLEPIIKETYGIVLFQEQSLRIASEVAGFDLVKADLMRQAIGKKDFAKMESMRADFIKGCQVKSGIPEDVALKIFNEIRASGRYAFNKCISGNEKIAGHIETIGEMFANRSFVDKKCWSLQKAKSPHGRISLKENEIVDIRHQGVRKIYRVTTSRGFTIRVTENHKFPIVPVRGLFGWIKEKRTDQLQCTKTHQSDYQFLDKAGDSLYFCVDCDKTKVFCDDVVSVDYEGIEEVFDVEVSGDVSHTFLTAGGIVTCNSHSTSYGTQSSIGLWFRYHHPHLFYATNISYTYLNVSDKTKRNRLVKDLIRSAKERSIQAVLPSIERRNPHTDFSVEENKVYLGFNCIAGTNATGYATIFNKIEEIEKQRGRHILEHSWYEILLYFSKAIGKTVMEALISIGSFDKIDTNRQGLLYDYDDWLNIQKSTEAVKWMEQDGKNTLWEGLESIIEGKVKGLKSDIRVKMQSILNLSRQNRPKSTPMNWVISQEETRLGITVTQVALKGVDLDEANITLADLGTPREDAVVAVYITETRVSKQRDGRSMMWINAIDNDGNESNKIVVFASDYHKLVDNLYAQASVMLYGKVSEQNSLIVNKVRTLNN